MLVSKCRAIMDSDVTSHFCLNHSKFKNLVSISPQDIHTADGSVISAIGKGDISIDLPLGEKCTVVTLKNTLYMPMMAFMLVSLNQITVSGLVVHFEGNMC